MVKFLIILLLSSAVFAQIPHPDSLIYGEMNWKIPDGKVFRKTIGNIPFYYEEDNSVALFTLQLSFAAGSLLEEPQPQGISSLYSLSIRNGGSKKFFPAEVDSLLALNAVSISVASDLTQTTFTVSGLSANMDNALEILEDIIQNPLWDSARVELNRTNLSQKTSHRFDNPSALLAAGWRALIYPDSKHSYLLPVDFPSKITTENLSDYHNYLVKDAKIIVAASGDIDESIVKNFVQKNFGKKRKVNSRELPDILPSKTAQTIIIHKDGLNQAYIATGLPAFKRPDERFYPLTVFNEILGGGGFNSRLVSQVRSDAGLTYSIYSYFSSN
jgi:zinc protease